METNEAVRKRPNWRKRAIIAAGVLSLLLVVVAYFLPYLLKRYIETHSEEWIDRKITIGRIVLNPFTLVYGVDELTCYEPHSEEVFMRWQKVHVRSNLLRALRSGEWRFWNLEVRDPYVHITQKGERFNFTDLIELASAEEPATPEPVDTGQVRFSMENIQVSGGRIDYASDLLHEPMGIQDLHATCNRITSESARMDIDLGFSMAKGGDLNGAFMIDTERSLYRVKGQVKKLVLAPLLPYLQDFMHTTALTGTLDLDLDLLDSWVDTTSLAVSARMGMNGLGITDGAGERLLALKSAYGQLDTLSALTSSFKLSTVRVDGFYTRYEMFNDGSDTWSKALKLSEDTTAGSAEGDTQLAASEENILVMLADYIRLLGQELIANEYNADSLVFTNGQVVFNDFTPEKPFRYTLSDVDMRSTRFGTGEGGVEFISSATLNNAGKLTGSMKFDPHDFRNVDMTYTVKGLALQDMDAYSRWYAAHPMADGVLEYTTTTSVHNGVLDSQNSMRVDRLVFGKKVDSFAEGIYLLPLRLAASLLKDKNGIVELDIPVSGDLRDPEFRVWPIIWKILKNLVSKAAAAPVNLIANLVGGEPKDLELVQFEPLQAALEKPQRKALEQLSKALQAKPDLTVKLVPIVDTLQEKEDLAAFEVKKRFLGYTSALAAVDSARIIGLSLRDTAFTQYLDANAPATKGRPEGARCLSIVGKADVDTRWMAIEQGRQQAVMALLTGPLGIPAARVTLRNGTREEVASFVGKPGYRFVYDAAEVP